MFLHKIFFDSIYCLNVFVIFFQDYCVCLEPSEGWNYINLHCRDNDNKPVDWWYIYKPSSDVGPYLEMGRNFSFITPSTAGRWQPSNKFITANSMLQHTLSPLYRPTYADYLAVFVYHERQSKGPLEGSSALGVMMADEMGGLWIGHTIPGFPDLTKDRPIFPELEQSHGHMIMCLTVDLVTSNEIAAAVRRAGPKVLKLKIPEKVKSYLPGWKPIEEVAGTKRSSSMGNVKLLAFTSRDGSLGGFMVARTPGDQRCLYKSFARRMSIVLDVYRHTEHPKNICGEKFSLRNINSISLKFPEEVHYINKETDKMAFAVSTGASWQRRGNSPPQFWTCIGNEGTQNASGKGALIVCVHHYNAWLTFDNLKIKEPVC